MTMLRPLSQRVQQMVLVLEKKTSYQQQEEECSNSPFLPSYLSCEPWRRQLVEIVPLVSLFELLWVEGAMSLLLLLNVSVPVAPLRPQLDLQLPLPSLKLTSRHETT